MEKKDANLPPKDHQKAPVPPPEDEENKENSGEASEDVVEVSDDYVPAVKRPRLSPAEGEVRAIFSLFFFPEISKQFSFLNPKL